MKYLALIAHDEKKPGIISLAAEFKEVLSGFNLVATGNTGRLIHENTGLPILRMQSGPLGGDQQIGALVASEQMLAVIFLRDPLAAQPHEPDVNALLRLCDVHNVPLATNICSARLLLTAISEHRELID